MKTQTHLKRFNFDFTSLLIVMALSVAIGCTSTVEVPSKADIGTVSLMIDFPDDTDQADLDLQIGCTADSTAFEILQRAETADGLEIEANSSSIQGPASIFIKGFNGVVGAEGRSWTYYVNGELAKEGCGTYLVKPDDKIRWTYGQPPAELE